MLVIGIVGGVASGKSIVSRLLGDLGALVVDADRLGHEVLEEPEVIALVRNTWGNRVLDSCGRVNRAALGRVVFEPSEKGLRDLAVLEEITHPRISEKLRAAIERAARQGYSAVVLDAAVMFKAGWDVYCDKLIFVDAPYPDRLARCRDRGWREEEFRTREAAQCSLDAKRDRADFVINNSSTVDKITEQTKKLWQTLDL